MFARFGRPPLALVPLVLDHNLRNTRQIATSFVPLAPTSMLLRGGDGPEVEFISAPAGEEVAVADDQVERLLDEGWQPQDVALLTMGARHPVQRERQESLVSRRTGRSSGRTRTSSTATSWASRAWSVARWSCA